MALVTLNSGASFQVPAGETILNSARQAQIALPYSCKEGRCSTCKCKIINGKTRSLYPESGLTEQEKAEGWILSCVRAVETDVLLEADSLGGVELPILKTWPCRISDMKSLAPDVVRVLLRLPPAADFRFLPGQYIDVIGANGVRRSYSLANSSFAEKVLELHIRAVEGGIMSNYWFNEAKVNDLLHMSGPQGTFFLRESAGIDVFFLATGTGIAPIKAIMESMANLSPDLRPKTVTVLWGGRRSQDLYLNVADMPGSHIYIPVQSQPADNWSGAKGYVQEVLLDAKPDLVNAAIYACGSEAMIYSAKKLLVEAGLSKKSFYSDAFVRSGTK